MVSRAWQSIFGETGPRQDSMLPLLETSVFKVLPGIPAAQRIVTLPTIASHSRLPPPPGHSPTIWHTLFMPRTSYVEMVFCAHESSANGLV